MNSNTKLQAITEQTLIVGIDVAKNAHVARVIDNRGVELCGRLCFENTREGFCAFTKEIDKLKILYSKRSVIIGLEPTGVYGNALIAFLKSGGYNAVYVLGMQVKRAKEIEDNSPSKNDFKDAKVIATLVKDGYYRKIRDFSDNIAELKEETRHLYQNTKKLTRVKCQIDNFITQFFPEFSIAFKDKEKKAAMATLHLFPLPSQICTLSAAQITQAWRCYGVIKGIGEKKAIQLKRLAAQTIGLKASEATFAMFGAIIAEYDMLTAEEDGTLGRIRALLEANADYHAIMQIPNMTTRLAAYLLAEVGDFRDFSHPQQLVRLAGLNLKESSSGKNRGTSEISKRGRPILRRTLYFIILEQLKHAAPGWHQLHNYYTTRKDNPLKKMQSVIVLCCKFLRVVWGMLNNGTPYDPAMLIRKVGHTNAA